MVSLDIERFKTELEGFRRVYDYVMLKVGF